MSRVRNTGGTVTSIWQRDKRRCWICGHAVARCDASRDHIHPRGLGGYDKSRNYRLAHRRCNSARWRLPVELVEQIRSELGNPSVEQMCQAMQAAHRTMLKPAAPERETPSR